MTVNERLFACGLMDRWDVVKRDGKKDEMIALLCEAALSKEQATWTVGQVMNETAVQEDEALHEPAERTKKDRVLLWITVVVVMGVAVWVALKLT